MARRRRSCYLRVDVAEATLTRAGVDMGVHGYPVFHELVISNLELVIDVVVDGVKAVPKPGPGGAKPLFVAPQELCRLRHG